MNDYKPNSHRFKEEQKQNSSEERIVNKVVKGQVKTKKKSEIGKIAGVFISEDVKNVKDYIVMDVLVPTIKKTIIGAIDMILNGGNATYTGRSSTSKVSYRKYYDEPRESHRSSESARVRTRFDYDDIIFESRGEAEMALEEMHNVIERYGFVTVADLYDMADLTQPYTSNKYGWINIRNAEVVRVNGGYIIKLPKAAPID